MRLSRTDHLDRPAIRRRVIVDRHRIAEQPDDEEADRTTASGPQDAFETPVS